MPSSTPPPTGPLRAVIYCRLSRATDVMEQSLARQREDCQDLADRRGYTVVEVLEDGGRSAYAKGGAKARPGYDRLLDLVRAGEVDVVLAWHTDRLARSLAATDAYLRLTREHRVRTEVVTGQGWDPSSSDGILLAQILGSIAESESRHKGERIHRAQEQAVQQGRFNRGARYRTFGYTRDGEVVPDEAEVLKDAASRLLDGVSLRSIVRDLRDAGVTTTTGKPMHHQQLRGILRNPKIAGISRWQPEDQDPVDYPGQWEAVLDRETWERLESLLTNPERVTNHVGAAPRWLLSGIARCGGCGGPLHARTINRGKAPREPRYYCKHSGDGRRHTSRKTSDLDGYVTAVVHSVLASLDVGRYLTATDDRDDAAVASLVAKRGELEDRLADLEAQLVNVTGGTVSVITRAVTKVSEELDAVTDRLAELNQAEGGSAVTVMAGATTLEDVQVRWETLDLDTRRAIVRELVTVVVQPSPPGRLPFNPDLVDVDLTDRAAGAGRE